MEYQEIRNIYKNFYYRDFEIYEDSEEIQIIFDFEIEGLSHFNPVFILPKPKDGRSVTELKDFREAAFSLGLVELISYWKIACPEYVTVECGSLDEEQISWWKKLYYYGLRDFFERNHIAESEESFMKLSSSGQKITGREDTADYSGNLIPVGGGKDSFVTLDLLKDMRSDNKVFIINSIRSALNSAEAAGYTGEDLIVASRSLDPRMLQFNKEGYLNGETPFSALTAFSALLTAIVYKKKYICLSNEENTDESTVSKLYSKTLTFESDFEEYTKKYLTDKVYYFSLLRPLLELQITGIFAGLPKYHSVFRSCGVGQKEGVWCGHCARCLLVAVMLSGYLSNEQITEIFGRDILNDMDMLELFAQLTGMRNGNPCTCTGTGEEVNLAIAMYLRRAETEDLPVPALYQAYRETPYYTYYRDRRPDLHRYSPQNNVPAVYETIVKKRIQEL